MTKIYSLTILILLAISIQAFADSKVFMIGGGNKISNSQGQIELNVNWAREVIKKSTSASNIKTYYTDGGSKEIDVYIQKTLQDKDSTLHPLARVFNQHRANGKQYHSSRLKSVTGPTNAEQLKTSLTEDFKNIKPTDKVLIVYNGHGSNNDRDKTKNALKLWGDTRLNVNEFRDLLNNIPSETPTRFVLTQCYSGAFAQSIYFNPAKLKVNPNRCGFMAESDSRQAEGCSASITIGEYRDYTTYFFAALDGKTRQGDKLPSTADVNGDGKVALREAHLYTLANAVSTDLSRSTSEDYLEKWVPWYLRWSSEKVNPDNEYFKIATHVSRLNNFPPPLPENLKQLQHLFNKSVKKMGDLEDKQAEISKNARKLRKNIQKALFKHWPQLDDAYTNIFHSTVMKNRNSIITTITSHPKYKELVNLQNSEIEMDLEILEEERRSTQIEKVLRLYRIARIKQQFMRYASESKKTDYKLILDCENASL